MKRLWKHLSTNRVCFFCFLAIGLIYSWISVRLPVASGNLVTQALAELTLNTPALPVFILFCLGQILLCALDNYLNRSLNLQQKRLMREKAFQSFSRRGSSGREAQAGFVSFVNVDLPSLVSQYFLGTIDIIKCLAILLFASASLISIHYLLALIILVISVLIVLVPKLLKKKSGQARRAYSAQMAGYQTTLQSFLGGLSVLRAYRGEARAQELLEQENQAVAQKERGILTWSIVLLGSNAFFELAKQLLILIVGIQLVLRGEIGVGDLVAVIQLAEIIGAPIEVLSGLIHSRNEVLPLLDQYEELTAQPDHPAGKPCGDLRELTVEGLSCSVGELSILRDVSARFLPGQKYLITGESGSGKSTLLRLMARVGELNYAGKICWNGVDIGELEESGYYEKLCPVFQEPYLFYASLKENICLGREIPREVYQKAIRDLELGYLLERCGERELDAKEVEQLSGGERQRIALARAMVGDPQVYLLDEVTSALDHKTARLIEDLMLSQEATVIHISHKPNEDLLPRYHARLCMRDGKLWEET